MNTLLTRIYTLIFSLLIYGLAYDASAQDIHSKNLPFPHNAGSTNSAINPSQLELKWFNREIAPKYPTFRTDRNSLHWKVYMATSLDDGTERTVGHRLTAARKAMDTQTALEIIATFYTQKSILQGAYAAIPAQPPISFSVQAPIDSIYDTYFNDFNTTLPGIVDIFNRHYPNLPATQIIVRECGIASASYAPRTRTVTFCYEMAERVGSAVVVDFGGLKQAANIHQDYVWFIFFHEMGHMFLDGQAALGREEDNADLLAVYLLPEKQLKSALLGALAMHKPKVLPTIREYAGRHSLDGARRANIVCWIYGKSPNQFSDAQAIFSSIGLSESRLGRCTEEYNKQRVAASKILNSYRSNTQTRLR